MFEGFSENTINFLWNIRMNNNREWYAVHKEECRKYLTSPMNELAGELFEYMDSKYPDLQLNVHMSRIYRDARRLYGKGPYKDYLWFTLHDANAEHWAGKPSFWFEIGADRWSYGLGCWDESTEMMTKFRKMIDARPADLLELDSALSAQAEFKLSGEDYKKQYQECHTVQLNRWYRKKNISIEHSEPVGRALTSRVLYERLCSGLDFLVPFYRYFFPIGKNEE